MTIWIIGRLDRLTEKPPRPLDGSRRFLIYYVSLFGATGLWRNWLAHWTVDPGVAGSSSVPAHVEMMGLIGMGNNPMVGATVAVAVAVEESFK